jgi:hypothetical protein
MLKDYKGKTFCFSPPVMLATLVIEFGMAIYVTWRYKFTTVVKLTIAMLLALGTFQLAEYMLCGGLGLDNVQWARFGYMSITLLPALGIHAIVALAKQKKPYLVMSAYLTCLLFLVFFALAPSAIQLHTCAANYTVFDTHDLMVWPYAFYYYGWLFIGGTLALKWSKVMPAQATALLAMAFGYASFIMPTTTLNLIDPQTILAIPSIMCGFAVIYAMTLTLVVLPASKQPLVARKTPRFLALFDRSK